MLYCNIGERDRYLVHEKERKLVFHGKSRNGIFLCDPRPEFLMRREEKVRGLIGG